MEGGEVEGDCPIDGVGGGEGEGVKKSTRRKSQSEPVKWLIVIPRKARLIVLMPLSSEKPALNPDFAVCAGVLENIFGKSISFPFLFSPFPPSLLFFPYLTISIDHLPFVVFRILYSQYCFP